MNLAANGEFGIGTSISQFLHAILLNNHGASKGHNPPAVPAGAVKNENPPTSNRNIEQHH